MSSTVPKELAKESHLTCAFCNHIIENPFKKSKTTRGCIVAVILLIGLIYMCNSPDSTPSLPYYITKDAYAATSKKTYDDIGRYAVVNDTQAIQELIYQGRIVLLPRGTEVHLVKSGFSYRVIRRVGSTQELWVDMESIKQER